MIWALHGAFGSGAEWDSLAARLRPERLEAVDLWADEYDLEPRAWARRFNQGVGDRAGVLLGYSMGARLALHALVEPAAPWTAAILVAPHPGLTDAGERLARRSGDDLWIERFDRLDWTDFWREWTEQPVLQTQLGREVPPKKRAMRRSVAAWSLSEQDDLRSELGRITCPVWVITGERDEKFTRIARDAVARMRRAKSLVVPGAGHRVPWEAPDTFAGLVRDCLDATVR